MGANFEKPVLQMREIISIVHRGAFPKVNAPFFVQSNTNSERLFLLASISGCVDAIPFSTRAVKGELRTIITLPGSVRCW